MPSKFRHKAVYSLVSLIILYIISTEPLYFYLVSGINEEEFIG